MRAGGRAGLGAALVLAALAHAEPPPESQLPGWAQPRWRALAAERRLALSRRVNPFLLRGDFDGDGRADLALLVETAAPRRIGIVVLHRATAAPHVLGAGTPFGNGGDSFDWLDVWSVEEPPAGARRRGEALLLQQEGAGGGLVSFEGGRYRWTQHGD